MVGWFAESWFTEGFFSKWTSFENRRSGTNDMIPFQVFAVHAGVRSGKELHLHVFCLKLRFALNRRRCCATLASSSALIKKNKVWKFKDDTLKLSSSTRSSTLYQYPDVIRFLFRFINFMAPKDEAECLPCRQLTWSLPRDGYRLEVPVTESSHQYFRSLNF